MSSLMLLDKVGGPAEQELRGKLVSFRCHAAELIRSDGQGRCHLKTHTLIEFEVKGIFVSFLLLIFLFYIALY